MSDIPDLPTEINKPEKKPKAADTDDVQAKYEALVKSGATAISSDMLFDEQARARQEKERTWNSAAVMDSVTNKLADMRESFGSKWPLIVTF